METITEKPTKDRIKIKDGQKDFEFYLSRVENTASVVNSFADDFEETFAELNLKFDKDWCSSFSKGWAKNELSKRIDEHVKTVPNSLRETVLEYHWTQMNEFLPKWNLVFTRFQNYMNPIGKSFPCDTSNIDSLPFNENGRMQISESFKEEVRPLFDNWAKDTDVVSELQKVVDVFNYLSKRISEGKAHENMSHFTLRRTAPIFLTENNEGHFELNAEFINSF